MKREKCILCGVPLPEGHFGSMCWSCRIRSFFGPFKSAGNLVERIIKMISSFISTTVSRFFKK
ncbi:MAG: hypothetical protein IJG67_03580 [Oscillospiraceae bacterium]|nr:hypothetical protein [Oscillospiraceae bacterium]